MELDRGNPWNLVDNIDFALDVLATPDAELTHEATARLVGKTRARFDPDVNVLVGECPKRRAT